MDKAVYTSAQLSDVRRVLPELFRSRQLLLDLIWKEMRVRYRYALLGFFWAVLEPLFMMAVLTFVFSVVFQTRIEAHGIESGKEYAVFVLIGLVAWQFLSTALPSATRSLVDNRGLVTKVYFPRENIPLASVGIALVQTFIGGILLLMVYRILLGHFPGPATLLLFPVFGIQILLVVGLGLLLSSLNAAFRDVSYMVDAGILFGFYATPIFYPLAWVSEAVPRLHTLYLANPMAGLITAYRQILFEQRVPDLALVLWPGCCAVVAIATGIVVFRKNAPYLADKL